MRVIISLIMLVIMAIGQQAFAEQTPDTDKICGTYDVDYVHYDKLLARWFWEVHNDAGKLRLEMTGITAASNPRKGTRFLNSASWRKKVKICIQSHGPAEVYVKRKKKIHELREEMIAKGYAMPAACF